MTTETNESTEVKTLDFDATNIVVFNEFLAELAELEEKNKKLVFDYKSKDGNAAARSHVAQLRKCNTRVSDIHKEAKAAALAYGRKLDATKNDLLERVGAMIDVHAKPLQEIKEKEDARIAAHNEKLDFLRNAAATPTDGLPHTSADLQKLIDEVEAFKITAKLEEFQQEAAQLKAYALSELNRHLANVKVAEEEKAELERLRKEAEEREQREREEKIAREAEEKARKEAEEKAAAEKAESEKREKEAKERAERAEREAEEAKERAAKAEQEAKEKAEREAREKAEREQREAAAREKDRKHKAAINNAAVGALIAAGLSEADSKKAVEAIAKKQVPNVTISY